MSNDRFVDRSMPSAASMIGLLFFRDKVSVSDSVLLADARGLFSEGTARSFWNSR